MDERPTLTVTRETAQKYTITAPRGSAKVRDDMLKTIKWRHAKRQSGYQFSKKENWNGFVQVWKPTDIKPGYIGETIDYQKTINRPLLNKSIKSFLNCVTSN